MKVTILDHKDAVLFVLAEQRGDAIAVAQRALDMFVSLAPKKRRGALRVEIVEGDSVVQFAVRTRLVVDAGVDVNELVKPSDRKR
jgi:hypothetical protein